MWYGTILEVGNLKLLKQFLFLECEKRGAAGATKLPTSSE